MARTLLMLTDPAEQQKEREIFAASRQKVDAIYTRIEHTIESEKGRQILVTLK